MSWDDRLKNTFEWIRDATKQILTLATALLGVSITLYGSIVGKFNVHGSDRLRLRLSWSALALAVLFGAIELLMVIRVSSPTDKTGAENPIPSAYDSGLRLWSILQISAFVIGVGFFAWFGAGLIGNRALPAAPTTCGHRAGPRQCSAPPVPRHRGSPATRGPSAGP